MANKYCNLDGTKKIKDEYKKINIGFDKVEEDLVNIIVTPARGVSEQEIIQARKGKATLNDRLNEMNNNLNSRIDNIIATPTTVSEQEIIDARQGMTSLGENMIRISSSVDESNSYMLNSYNQPIYNYGYPYAYNEDGLMGRKDKLYYGSHTGSKGRLSSRTDRMRTFYLDVEKGDIFITPPGYLFILSEIIYLENGDIEWSTLWGVGWVDSGGAYISPKRWHGLAIFKRHDGQDIPQEDLDRINRLGLFKIVNPKLMTSNLNGEILWRIGGRRNSTGGVYVDTTSLCRAMTYPMSFQPGDSISVSPGSELSFFVFAYTPDGDYIGRIKTQQHQDCYVFQQSVIALILTGFYDSEEPVLMFPYLDTLNDQIIIHRNRASVSNNTTSNVEPNMRLGKAISGKNIIDSAGMAASIDYIPAKRNSYIMVVDDRYEISIQLFSGQILPKYIHEFTYAPNSDWMIDSYITTVTSVINYVFEDDLWFRIDIGRVDGSAITESELENLSNIVKFYGDFEESNQIKSYFKSEIDRVTEEIYTKSTRNSLVFCQVTDTHVTINGTWEDTVRNIKAIHDRVNYRFTVHLGDITDGRTPGPITRKLSDKCLASLRRLNIPLHLVLGNHDSNYQYSSDIFTPEEMFTSYFRGSSRHLHFDDAGLSHYADYHDPGIRVIGLDSFVYNRSPRYGYTNEQITWVQSVLNDNPDDLSIVILSHSTPIGSIYNGALLLDILNTYNQTGEVIGVFYGHSHIDMLNETQSFPIVGTVNTKCEDYKEGPSREINTLSQESWDTVIIDKDNKLIQMVRFGAGESRTISYG